MSDEIAYMTATDLIACYRKGALSPSEVIEVVLARLEKLEPGLNAFQLVDADAARAEAARSTDRWAKGEPRGALDGVPISIKDIVATAGWPTRSGSLATPEAPGTFDAPCVARLREAGAVLFGKTTTPEFGWKGMTDSPLKGVTRNPWNLAHTPGGSSGGAGAAMAAGVGALAHGNDGGGSVRIPSSYCGLYGLKPTFGRVPHHPQDSPFSTLSASGPLARSVADAALMLNEMAKPDARDWYALPYDGRDYLADLDAGVAGLKVGFSADLGGAEVVPEVLEIVSQAANRFTDLGAEVTEVGPVIEPLRPVFENYWLAGFGFTLSKVAPEKRDLLEPRFRELAEQGAAGSKEVAFAGMVARAALGSRFNEFHETYDLLLTPTMPTPPPTADTPYHSEQFDRWYHAVPFTVPFNLTGQPAASVPCGLTAAGLPVGLQIVGPRYSEALILRAMRAFEQAAPVAWPNPAVDASLNAIS